MLEKNIQPVDINELAEDEIEYQTIKALEDLLVYWEKHGSFLLTRPFFKEIDRYYYHAKDCLKWIERS